MLKPHFLILWVEPVDYLLEASFLQGFINFSSRHLEFSEGESFLGIGVRVCVRCSSQGEKSHLLSDRINRGGFLSFLFQILRDLLLQYYLLFLFSKQNLKFLIQTSAPISFPLDLEDFKLQSLCWSTAGQLELYLALLLPVFHFDHRSRFHLLVHVF